MPRMLIALVCAWLARPNAPTATLPNFALGAIKGITYMHINAYLILPYAYKTGTIQSVACANPAKCPVCAVTQLPLNAPAAFQATYS